MSPYLQLSRDVWATYSLGNVVYHDGAVGISVVHGSQGLVSLLAGSIPDLKLDRGGFVERDGLSQESGADGRFSERVELVLSSCEYAMADKAKRAGGSLQHTLTNLRTIEL
jgi:hypothetical protein